MTIQELAKQMCEAFVTDKRNSGAEFVHLKDGSPQWMSDVIRKVHGDKLPDDTVYRFIEWSASALAEYDVDGTEPIEAIYELQPNIYTNELTGWLHERADHIDYLDQAIQEYRESGASDLLSLAQKFQIDEVGSSLLHELKQLAE